MFSYIFDLLDPGKSRIRSIEAGSFLFHRNDLVRHLYLVLEGEIQLIRHQDSGSAMVLQNAKRGDIVADASVFSEKYHCDALTLTHSVIQVVEKEKFREYLLQHPESTIQWAARLAKQVQDARLRSEILSLKRVSEKLDAWLDWHRTLPPKGEWRQLALQIAVSPEALYREIAKRRGSTARSQ
ncbi:Crp/Fnr family transcriptional regulator [Pseudovibrio japonicus]|uniref:Crp/Fnr family transcriptional regulator n=1 Tax=Pseudovibrio japonicus TaxID=366534 RepID=UPI00167AED43|nr:Crp/Fnr family transcriptional regulator [Pseudovibrio japonicus]